MSITNFLRVKIPISPPPLCYSIAWPRPLSPTLTSSSCPAGLPRSIFDLAPASCGRVKRSPSAHARPVLSPGGNGRFQRISLVGFG